MAASTRIKYDHVVYNLVAVIDPATVVLAVVMVGAAVVGTAAWRQRPQPGSTTLTVLMLALAVWTGGVILAAYATGYWPSRMAVNLVITSTAVSTVAFFAFALEYTGREQYLRWPYPLAFAVEPVAVALLTTTNEVHGLFWTDVVRDSAHYSGYTHVAGLGQDLHIGFAYLLTAVSIGLLVQRLLRSRAVYRTQSAAVLLAALGPVLGNVLYVTDIFPLGQIVGFGFAGVALYWAVTRGRLVDLTPVARTTILEELEMGVVVIDDQRRVTDSNGHARSLLGIPDEATLIGSELPAVLGRHRALLDSDGRRSETIDATVDGEPRQLHVTVSPLTDGLDRRIGRLLLFEDVTERERRREEIERQNERLREFASMVSHDLRNPLDVASGYVELMRGSREESGDGTTLEVDKLDETADALARIETIVDDVLTLAREGEAATDPETVSLRSTARAAWDHVSTDDASVVIGTDAMVVADRERLVRLFENLFRNAVEHGSTGSQTGSDDAVQHGATGEEALSVSVGTITESGDPVGFYVEDDGEGIPEDIVDRVFESGVTTEQGGTGFGLAIVDQLAAAHGWDVAVTASEEGGARFEFTAVDVASPVVRPEETEGEAS